MTVGTCVCRSTRPRTTTSCLFTSTLDIDDDFAGLLMEEGLLHPGGDRLRPVNELLAIDGLDEMVEELRKRAKDALTTRRPWPKKNALKASNLPKNHCSISPASCREIAYAPWPLTVSAPWKDLAEQGIDDLADIKS